MVIQNEKDPTQGIVDIDTFSYFLVGFISNVRENPLSIVRQSKEREAQLLDGVTCKLGISNFSGREDFLENSYSFVHIEACSFSDFSDSLQGLLIQQFGSERISSEKKVRITLSSDAIFFQVETPPSPIFNSKFKPDFQQYSLRLSLIDEENPFKGDIKYRKGDWSICYWPQSFIVKQETAMLNDNQENWSSLLTEAKSFEEKQEHASLSQLLEIARLLDRFKDKTILVCNEAFGK